MQIRSRSSGRHAHIADLDGTILIPELAYIDAVRNVLGTINLDPCSAPKAQVAIGAQAWYRADQSNVALAEPWHGQVFLHPHPNTTIARHQLQKLMRDYLNGRVNSAIVVSGRSDWLRREPLLLSFPFLLHYKRLSHLRWDAETSKLQRFWPSWEATTFGLPRRNGPLFDEAWIDRFVAQFSRYGRVIMAEDLGDNWQQQAIVASREWHIPPVLTDGRRNRVAA